jgi:anti-sigma B factor antagonist
MKSGGETGPASGIDYGLQSSLVTFTNIRLTEETQAVKDKEIVVRSFRKRRRRNDSRIRAKKCLTTEIIGLTSRGLLFSLRLFRLGSSVWVIGTSNEPGVPCKESSMSSQPRRRRLEVEPIGDVTVVNFVDRKILDEQNIQVIGDQLFSLVEVEGIRKLLLNFGNVEYLSSAALGKLITLNKKLQTAGGRLILCNIDPQILEVFEITKLDKFFNIQKEEQAALQAF